MQQEDCKNYPLKTLETALLPLQYRRSSQEPPHAVNPSQQTVHLVNSTIGPHSQTLP